MAGVTIVELFDVEGYGVVVTGGASGLGLGYGEALARNGARVTLLDLNRQMLDEEVARLGADGLDVRGAVVDVTDHATLDAEIDAAAAQYGRLDVVFANAGIDPGPGFLGAWAGDERPRNPDGVLENYTDERWNHVIDINLNGVFATVRAAARHMKKQGSGAIIITTSVASTQNEPAIGAAYMAAKAACRHLTHSVAHEMAAHGVRVNAIAPGFFATNIGGGHAKTPEMAEAMGKIIPMHRIGDPYLDVAGLALFLASPASGYLTGQEIQIDGGWALGAAD
jgi:NAD(P)-dependent dehydrogenase (short-subunit alcohol dehydrogenase family)